MATLNRSGRLKTLLSPEDSPSDDNESEGKKKAKGRTKYAKPFSYVFVVIVHA